MFVVYEAINFIPTIIAVIFIGSTDCYLQGHHYTKLLSHYFASVANAAT